MTHLHKKVNCDNDPFDGDKLTFLSQLPLVDPTAISSVSFLEWNSKFPLVIDPRPIETSLKEWFSRLKHDVAWYQVRRQDHRMLVIFAPKGSGKTHFLRLLCQLFQTQWDGTRCMNAIMRSDLPKTRCDSTEERLFHQAIEVIDSVKSSKTIIRCMLQTKGELAAEKVFTSTHSCYINFGNVTELERSLLQNSPLHMLIARIIFAEFSANYHAVEPKIPGESANKDVWITNFQNFLERYSSNILQIHSLCLIIDYFRNYYQCQNYFLAIDFDDLAEDEDETNDPLLGRSIRLRLVEKVLYEVGILLIHDHYFMAIVANQQVKPLDEYLLSTRHAVRMVHLSPLDPIAMDRLIELVLEQYNEAGHKLTIGKKVRHILLLSGGHPKLLSDLLSWLLPAGPPALSPSLNGVAMTLKNACEKCGLIDQEAFKDTNVQSAIIDGTWVPKETRELFQRGVPGMLTRPVAIASSTHEIASPLVLYQVLSEFIKANMSGGSDYIESLEKLVPSNIIASKREEEGEDADGEGDDFVSFLMHWFAMQLRRGLSFEILFNRCPSGILEYYDMSSFLDALPISPNKDLVAVCVEKMKSDDLNNWLLDENASAGIKIVRHSSTAFDFMICQQWQPADTATTSASKDQQSKRILLVKCFTQESHQQVAATADGTFDANCLARVIQNCTLQASSYFENGWKVGLLVVVSACSVSSSVIAPCLGHADNSPERMLEECCCVINKSGLSYLFGSSFASGLAILR